MGLVTFSGLMQSFCKSQKSITFFSLTTEYWVIKIWLSVMPCLLRFQTSFWNFQIPSGSWSFITICMPTHKSPLNICIFLFFLFNCLILSKQIMLIILETLMSRTYENSKTLKLGKTLIFYPIFKTNEKTHF